MLGIMRGEPFFEKRVPLPLPSQKAFEKSFLHRESDYSICVYADEQNYPVEAVSARVAHICIIDALMLTIASFNYDDYVKHISLRNAALENIRY